MSNMHKKRFSTSLVIREMQTKTTMKYHFTPTGMAITKKMESYKDNCKCIVQQWLLINCKEVKIVGMEILWKI